MGDLVYLKEPTVWETDYFDAVKRLADARVRYSQEFQVNKMQKGTSDELARQRAIEETRDEITVLEGLVEITRQRLIKS